MTNCYVDEAGSIEWLQYMDRLYDILQPLKGDLIAGLPKCDTAIERFMPPLPEPVSTLISPMAYGLETSDIVLTADGRQMEVTYKSGNTLTVKELAVPHENRKQRRKRALAQKLRLSTTA